MGVASEQMTYVLDNAWKQRSLFLANLDSSFVLIDLTDQNSDLRLLYFSKGL